MSLKPQATTPQNYLLAEGSFCCIVGCFASRERLPGTAGPRSQKVLTAEQVGQIVAALDLREQLVVRLAIHSGMRPGEIIGLQWKHVKDDHVEVEQRIYRGKIDRPKTARSKRLVALSPETQTAMESWKAKPPCSPIISRLGSFLLKS